MHPIIYATVDVQDVVLAILQHFGAWGNTIFFVCSAWFLVKSDAYKKRKWFFMLVEIWTISFIILVVTYIILGGNISGKIVIKSLFPTLFANNWYMTCYLLFYPIHPLLNRLIQGMSKKMMFRVTFFLSFLYIGLDTIKGDWFFPSPLILWIVIYLVIAYMEMYMENFSNNVKANIVLLVISAVCFLGLVLLTDVLGLHIGYLSDKLLHWDSNCNMFLILMTIAMFNLSRQIHFKSTAINYISKLSLLIYVIHENLILRTYFRPRIWEYIYHNYGYGNVVGWVFALAVGIFLFGLVAAILYERLLQRLVSGLSNKLYDLLRGWYINFEDKMTRRLS